MKFGVGCGLLLVLLLCSSCATVAVGGGKSATVAREITATKRPVQIPIQPTPTITAAPSPEGTSTGGMSYYVSPSGSDAADGSQGHPFATIQKAADRARAGTMIHVLPGMYTDRVVNSANGTATARITFISDSKWGAKLKTSGTAISWINYGDYVDIVGFDVSGDGSDATVGIDNFGSFGRIIGNHVHDYAAASCEPTGAAGIENSENGNNHDNDIIGNVVDAIGPPVTMYCNFDQGIYVSTAGGHVFNNIVYHVAAFGIHMWHAASGVTVANNLVFECGRGGILIGSNEMPADNFVVVNNIAIYNHEYGIYEYGSVGTHNWFRNNLVYENPTNLALQSMDEGTVIANPGFVNYQADGSGNYHLRANSPAVGAGTSVGAPMMDIDGVARAAGRIDIGPY